MELVLEYLNKVGLDHTFEQVKEFHEAFNHPVSESPTLMTPERAETRMTWVQEEVTEFLEAKTVVDQADAMIDVIYFAIGTLVEMGVKPQALMDIVQGANMSKLWLDGKPRYKEDGKVMKPEGWLAPEPFLEEEIQKQIAAAKE